MIKDINNLLNKIENETETEINQVREDQKAVYSKCLTWEDVLAIGLYLNFRLYRIMISRILDNMLQITFNTICIISVQKFETKVMNLTFYVVNQYWHLKTHILDFPDHLK